jgi:hypothetical protein
MDEYVFVVIVEIFLYVNYACQVDEKKGEQKKRIVVH